MRGAALHLVLLTTLCYCADSSGISAFLSIDTEAVSSSSSAAVKPYLRIREVQRGTTGNPREDGTDLQHIAVSLAHRTNPYVNDILIDSIDHVDSGLYRVAYTPIVSGQYDASITIKGDNISTDLSNGLTIRPARADAIKSTHNASPLVTEGIDETFAIQAIDRYGNELWSELSSKEDEFLVDLKGAPHVCSGREGDAIAHPVDLEYSPEVSDVETDAEYSGSGGLYKASYTPMLAGTHQVSIRLRSVGGLLGTYYRNADFTRPVWGNSDHVFNGHPASIPWCEPDVVECDSTRLDTSLMFDWGFGSPLRVALNDYDDDNNSDDDDNNNFPIDSFSAKWVGELKVPATDEYTFYVTLNGQAKLMVGESVLIDTMANPSQSKTVSSETIELVADTFYPITMEYIHHTDEALIQLEWSSWNSAEKEAVPSSALYYTRHLGNDGENQGIQNTNDSTSSSHPSSPFPVEVLPGAIDLTSSPSSNVDVDDHEGDASSGLNTCVATTECSFVIQTKDSEGNNRYNDGTDPAFVLSMTGTGGWAGDGRVNDDLTYSTKPLEVSPLVSVPLDWQYLDMVEVVHGSNQLTTDSNLLSKGLKRGDHVIVAGQTYTVSSSLDRTFDETTVPLDESIIGPSMPSTALYKTGLGCNTGKHLITYTPQVRGEYALDARLPSVPEVQRIQIVVPDEGPNSASGTFTLTYRSSDGNMQTTADISYDANVDELKEALESLSNLSEVELGLDAYSCVVDGDPTSGCSWDVTFVGSDLEGDVELLMPNDGDLVGASVVIAELQTGIPARSISGFPRTVTVVPDAMDPTWTTAHGQGLVLATAGVEAEFTIQAKDDAGNNLLSNVDHPDALFEIIVTPDDGGDGDGAAVVGMVAAEDDGRYRVSYTPTKSGRHAINVVVKSTAGVNAPIHIKKSPFRVFVDPAPINPTNSVASDSPGVIHHEGLSTGVYDSQTHFSIQLYDEFGNRAPEGPQSEVQIIEMWSLLPLGGTFDISYRNNKVTLPAGAGIAEVEWAIQTLPGLGDVTVTTNAAKDTVAAADGRTVAVTTGLDTLVPSQRLDDEFSEGDWIRIGSRDDGPVFTIVAMSTATPFTVTLSSAYMGESDSAAAIYGQSLHGSPFGFQYIVSFDSTVGDVEALEVDGENLDGGDDETTIYVTTCDHNVHQTIETHADGSGSEEDPGAWPSISGTFYLSYKGHRTPDLSASIDAASLEAVIEETFSSMDGGIREVTVLGEVDLERGAKRWNLRLELDGHASNGDDQPSLLFAEGHLLSSGSITVTAVCPIASSGDSLLEAPSQAGRSGQEFNIALVGVEDQGSDEGSQSSMVHGQAHYVADGLYEASYKSPRVGEYTLHIDTALSGGLYGRYYNNRWLFGSPIEERVDETIDFVWNDTHPVNEAIGNEFISVRWTGYVKAAFNEVYSFRMRVNDGARLWIGDELIIDEFDSIVEKEDEEAVLYREYQGNTTVPLETTRLTAIKIEFQQNRGDATMRLEWSSETQPWSVVESYRLFHEGQSVDESPYVVHSQPIAPTEPRNCSATVVGAKSFQAHWMKPEDDGGEDVQSYRVVVEDIEASFVVFDETLLVQDLVDTMPMASSMYSLDIGDDNKEARVESATSIPLLIAGKQYGVQVSAGNSQDDQGPFCRQVLVRPMSEPMAVKTVLIDRHPTSPTSLIVSFDPVVEERTNGSEVSHYRFEWSTDASFGVTGGSTTSATVETAALLPSSSQDNDNFLLYEIQELEPGQEYHVRVTAMNAVGAGPPSSMPALLAPGSEPEPIEQNRFMLRIIEASGGDGDGTDDDAASVVTVGESSTSLLASWPIHPIRDGNGFAVEKYVLEYFIANEDAPSSLTTEPSRIKTIEIDADAHNYTLTGLSPGQPISARIYAKNILGLSTATVAIPDELAPPRQPPSEPINVQLSRVDGGGDESGSSLSVSWDSPTSDGGDAITKYLVEHSTDEDFSPSSTDFGAYTKVDCQDNQRCRHTILGLTEGMSYYVRVFAGNSYGFSRTALSRPTSLTPMSPPDRLDRVNIATDDGNNGQHIVNVSWRRRGEESGGIVSPTTAYKVEWVETSLYQDYTTQRIQASGPFRLSFQGHKTKLLAVDCSAYKMKQALESLPTIGSAEVFKEDAAVGSGDDDEGPAYTSSWLATFPNFRHMEKMEIELGGGDSTETDPAAAVEYVVEAFRGYEVQSVTCERCLDAAAQREQSFRLSHLGNATAALPLSITPSALEAALRDIGVGEVEVSRRTDRNIQGYEWKVTFTSLLGDLPLLQTLVDPHSEVRMYIGELAKGRLPPMTGSSYGSFDLSAREAESKADANGWIHWSVEIPRKRKPYYFQASASNEVGFGPPMYSTPPTI